MPLIPPGVHEHFPEDREQLTPLFRQYTDIKRQHPEALLLYRLGDFYEMFGPDAVRGSEILGLTLTSRACHKDYKVAMCGIPHHASARYIKRLVEAGEIVAICDQIEDPAQAQGLVERAVTRVITAGTLIEDEYLSADSSSFLAVAAERHGRWGVALLDASGGGTELFELPAGSPRVLLDVLLRRRPAELLLPASLAATSEFAQLRAGHAPACHRYETIPGERDVEYFLARYFHPTPLGAYGLAEADAAQAALFALIRYLKDTFRTGDFRLYPRLVPPGDQLYLGPKAIAHLELLESIDTRGGGSLYGYLSRLHTAAGRRLLKQRLLAPYADSQAITASHAAVEQLLRDKQLAESVALQLDQLQDIERIVQRVTLRRSNPKELRALAASLPLLSKLRQLLASAQAPLLLKLAGQLADFANLSAQLENLLADDPPVRLAEGETIRAGADSQVDELRDLVHGGQAWMEAYQERERERTGIRTLKVRRTDAFGYFIEISKGSLSLAPADYERKQTLVGAERFVTPALKQRETDLQSAAIRLAARERELFEQLCAAVTEEAERLAAAARAAAELDLVLCFTTLAREHGWVRPELIMPATVAAGDPDHKPGLALSIKGGRHPVVEGAVGSQYFTRNDCYLDQQQQQVIVLTGPNMGGKSTYLRMVAVICIINQLGSFVPAEQAALPVFDRIYTRVGAQDALGLGQSTFMVEMVETAEILHTCGERSLILLDEVGRGTSTYDGISIAKAVVEHLHEHPARPLTLFATHFFELTDLELILARVRNFQVEVLREREKFVLLYRVSAGAASDSFGIEVAALAGLPDSVVQRARVILRELEEAKQEARERARRAVQLGLFSGSDEK